MAERKVNLDDYVDVPTRIAKFRLAYPDGRLTATYEFVRELGGADWVVVTAYVYKSPDDENPATGLAWERVPGLTNYTRNSELQNAETSAWGRALIANGVADAKHIASKNEVESRTAERDPKALEEALVDARAQKTIEDAREAYKRVRALGASPETLDELANGFAGLPSRDEVMLREAEAITAKAKATEKATPKSPLEPALVSDEELRAATE